MKSKLGFTLIEILIVLSIIATLLLGGVYFGKNLTQRNQVAIIEAEIVNAIHYARLMSMMQGEPMTINPDPITHDWSNGMVLFPDNRTHLFTKDDKLLHQWQWKCSGVVVQWKGFRSEQYLIFSSILKQSTLSGSFHIYVNQKEEVKLIVNRLGHIRRAPSTSS